MSRRVRDHSALLRFLSGGKGVTLQQIKTILRMVTDEQAKAIGEIAVNLLYGTIPITAADKKKLKKFSSFYDYIGDSSIGLKKRKSSILRHPTAVTALIRAAAPMLQL